jgi:ATP-dependent Clp protease ATP-binding subunit ClpX
MYDTPASNYKHVVINSKVVLGERKAIYLTQEQQPLSDKIIAEDDDNDFTNNQKLKANNLM